MILLSMLKVNILLKSFPVFDKIIKIGIRIRGGPPIRGVGIRNRNTDVCETVLLYNESFYF
jgi:hypothetical protein